MSSLSDSEAEHEVQKTEPQPVTDIPPAPPLPLDISEDYITGLRTSWIYLLKKGDLVAQLRKFNLDATGPVYVMRRRLAQFVREGRATPQPRQDPFAFPSCSYPPNTSTATIQIDRPPNPVPTPTLSLTTPTTTTITTSTYLAPQRSTTFAMSNFSAPVYTAKVPVVTTLPPTCLPSYYHPVITQPPIFTMPTSTAVSSPPVVYPNTLQSPPVVNHPSTPSVFQQNIATTIAQPSLAPNNPGVLKIHRWNIHFDGNTDPATFLERLEEICVSQAINPDSVIPHLPEILKGEAALWYRNNRHTWTSWNEFRTAFRIFYFPVNYEVDLEAEISRRLQRSNEPVAKYVTALQTLIRRHGNISPEQELNWLYRNLLAEYRQYIRRNDFHDTGSFSKAVREYEALNKELQESRRFRPFQTEFSSRPPREPQPTYRPIQPQSQRPPYIPPPPQETSSMHTTVTERATAEQTGPDSSSTGHANRGNRESVCWRCGRSGHVRQNCRFPPKIFCSRCGREGIMSRDCSCRNQGNGQGTVPQRGQHR